ncbi:aconitate hydratase 1 [Burkholderiales bacterium 8X]|nr:aconitate hydratase 1 [Burkholderiales bacterium 8X]
MATGTAHAFAPALKTFKTAAGKSGKYWSLKELAKQYPHVDKLPVSIRIVLESVLRNCDGKKITRQHVEELAAWTPNAERTEEIPFVVTRVVLQDFTGVPLLADLAAMRSVAQELGKSPKTIEPLVPVDLVVDHSVMVDYYGTPKALDLNMKLEFQRNNERYQFMKWGMQAFDTFRVVPPGFGIVHQVNLEYFARGVYKSPSDQGDPPVYYPDSLVGTDSHTTMINGVGVVGWGVGGIEAEAAMLGQPVYMLTPDVVGFELTGKLREGVTATDLVLFVTAILRSEKVVGKFVEFFGPGAASIAVPDRATIGNMAPEYGATMGFFPVDEMTVAYFKGTGRTDEEVELFEAYYKAQGLFGMPTPGQLEYTKVVKLDLGTVTPSVAGPKRPQDRINLGHLSTRFSELFSKPNDANGFNQPAEKLHVRYPVAVAAPAPVASERPQAANDEGSPVTIGNGDVLIAAITSCTNTSNPSVMLGAGLLAKKAVEAGLTVKPHVKTSLAPGSRIVTDYLEKAGLLPYLEKLGFYLAGYGCTTCIGNAGDLTPEINEVISENNLIGAAVLSGNRNFEARIHPNLKANFLASPPLVVAYAIAGNVMVDLMTQPVGKGTGGKDVYLGDIWPTMQEIDENLRHAMNAQSFRKNYEQIQDNPGALWSSIKGTAGEVYDWPESTYIAEPPFFEGFQMQPRASDAGIQRARIMALFGDSITTDHISPAGAIKEDSPAGIWLKANGVSKADFNSYGSRRGNHDVMMRGTFANVRIKNLMLPADANGSQEEGGLTLYQPGNQKMFIYDAAMKYIEQGVPTVIFGGEEYGTGSSRDWAAKGTQLLGIKAVVARSFERIHRANLVGMGVLPLQFRGADSWQTLGLTGEEEVDVVIGGDLKPQMDVKLIIRRADGSQQDVTVRLRIDTPIEVDYYKHGGILPFVLRQLLA